VPSTSRYRTRAPDGLPPRQQWRARPRRFAEQLAALHGKSPGWSSCGDPAGLGPNNCALNAQSYARVHSFFLLRMCEVSPCSFACLPSVCRLASYVHASDTARARSASQHALPRFYNLPDGHKQLLLALAEPFMHNCAAIAPIQSLPASSAHTPPASSPQRSLAARFDAQGVAGLARGPPGEAVPMHGDGSGSSHRQPLA